MADAELDGLDALAARLRELDAVGVAIAEDARPAVEAAARETAAAGTSPTGEAWKPRKADGARALPAAASAITAEVSGLSEAVLVLVLRGAYVYHDRAKGKSRRQILFSRKDGVPAKIAEIVAASAKRVIARAMGGR